MRYTHYPNRTGRVLWRGLLQLGRAPLVKKPKYESPARRLKRVRAEAEAEALRWRQMPLDGAAFDGFLRSGRPG